MQRFRLPILVGLVLGLAYVRVAGAMGGDAVAARTVSDAPGALEESGSSAPALARYDIPLLAALVPSTGSIFEIVSTKKGSTVRSTCRHGAEDQDHWVSRACGGAACRARWLEIAHLQFASDLAAARSGRTAFRADIPPPQFPI